MEERVGEAFAQGEHLTVIGRKLQPGEIAPDFFRRFSRHENALADRGIQSRFGHFRRLASTRGRGAGSGPGVVARAGPATCESERAAA